MCDYEEFLFACGCSTFRLKSYCHFARNDPNHQCFGVKKLRDTWDQASDCEACSQRKTNDQWARSQGFGGGAYASTGSSAAGELPPPKTVFSCLSISFLFLFWNRA